MKNFLKYLAVIGLTVFLFSSCTSTSYIAQPAYQDAGPVTYQSFYDNLSPYGNWISYPGYGNVWAPHAEAGFRPYATNGQWRYSNDGWAWQSNYNWGWAPFHYGRWLYDDNYGWLWVPGYDWSPAWVTWGSVDNYYAWAPLMPEVNVGVQYSNWRPHAAYWNVVPREHIGDRNVSNVIVHNTQINNNTTVINNTNITKNITIINNYNTSRTNNYYAKGPDVHEVERYTKNTIQPVSFKEVNQIHKPNQQSNVMEVYRPVVQNPGAQNTGNVPQNNSGRPAEVNNRPPAVQSTGANKPPTNVNPEPHPVNQVPNPGLQPVNTTNAAPRQQQNTTPDQYQDPRHSQNLPSTQPITPVQNTPPVRSAPQVQNVPANQNQNPPPQPHKFRTVNPAQTMPIREESQVPVMQPRQQRRNVEQLPVQRAQPANNGNFNNNRVQRPVSNGRP